MNPSLNKIIIGFFIASIILMLVVYHGGYDYAINWEVTTTAEVIEFPAWEYSSGLMNYEIMCEKYVLSELYQGSEMIRNISQDQVLYGMIWLSLCILLVASTYLKRFWFFLITALLALFLHRLHWQEVSLFGYTSKWVVFIPFVLLISPLFIFHEYKKNVSFLKRVLVLLASSVIIISGIDDPVVFMDHLIAHSVFSLAICVLLFLLVVSEEILFGILYVTTSTKGEKNNHIHFLILSLIYVGNLVLSYLNKSGLYPNNFFFFDPFILLVLSGLVSLWSLRFKATFLNNHLQPNVFITLITSLGIVTYIFIAHQMIRGNDAIYQAFSYLILYFHLGFGVMFFFYIVGNFIDPLIKGFEVHKIVYKERNLPYFTTRLAGFIVVLGFYFLAAQEPFNLLKSGYYNYLAVESKTNKNQLLANEYLLQSSFIGYHTHYPNYTLGWNELKKNKTYPAKTYFFNAAQRYPSAYAWVNYGNLDAEINPNKVVATLQEALRHKDSGEIANNLGMVHMQKGELESALQYFEKASPSDTWNDAPTINKWGLLKKLNTIDTTAISSDYFDGNFGVRANILANQDTSTSLPFIFSTIATARPLHRQAYLLNSSYVFSHDSVHFLIRKEINKPATGTTINRLRKALAIHLYKKGEVNQAFMMMDYLQAHAHQLFKGTYLDAMGKLALEQKAYKLAIDFFTQAMEVKHYASIFGKLDAMAHLNQKDQIPAILLEFLKKHPEYTNTANIFLDRLGNFHNTIEQKKAIPTLDSLDHDSLIRLGRENAFNVPQVIAVVDELSRRGVSGGYELLVDAIEINPYTPDLLKKYVMVALEWNLVAYADQTVEKLQEILPPAEFEFFQKEYNQRKKELANTEW